MPGIKAQKSLTPNYPGWFIDFLANCAVRKPSPHTAKAYRQDFEAIAALVAGSSDCIPALRTTELNVNNLRAAFAVYAETHSAASIRRCWPTWNTVCTFLYTAQLLDANPMPLVASPWSPHSATLMVLAPTRVPLSS